MSDRAKRIEEAARALLAAYDDDTRPGFGGEEELRAALSAPQEGGDEYRRGVEDAAKWIDKAYRLTIDGANASLGNIMRAALAPAPGAATGTKYRGCPDCGWLMGLKGHGDTRCDVPSASGGDAAPATDAEVRAFLIAEGIDPDAAVERMRARVKAITGRDLPSASGGDEEEPRCRPTT